MYDYFDESSLAIQAPPARTGGYDLDPVLKDVELALIKRCAYFDRCRNEWKPPEIKEPGSIAHRIQAITARIAAYIY